MIFGIGAIILVLFLYYFVGVFLKEIANDNKDYELLFYTTLKLIVIVSLFIMTMITTKEYKELEIKYQKLKIEKRK
jgi:uncharacterized membrane protein YedE/YeeE